MSPRVATALILAFVGAVALGYGAGGAVRASGLTTARVTSTPTPVRSFPSTAGGPDLTALAEKCTTLTTGKVADYLQPDALIHGTEQDPRTHQTLPVLRTIFTTVIPVDRPPFSITATVQQAGLGGGSGSQPIDKMGSVQFWMYWDGSTLDKGVRHWNGQKWVMAINNDAPTLTAQLLHNSAAFHSSEVRTGDLFAIVTSDAGGCAALGVDEEGRPASGF